MRCTLFVAGTAVLAFTTPSLASAAAKAQLRSEREATRRLNTEQVQKAEAANGSLRPKVTDASAANPMNSPPAAAPTARIARSTLAEPTQRDASGR